MRSKLNCIISFALGALIFGGGIGIAASGMIAYPSSNVFFINGVKTDIKAIITEENTNYTSIRSIMQHLNYSTVWDPSTGYVYIDTSKPYDANEKYEPPGGQSVSSTRASMPESKPTVKGDVIKTDNGDYVIDRGKPKEAPLPVLPDYLVPLALSVPIEEKTPIRVKDIRYGLEIDDVVMANVYETQRFINWIYLCALEKPSLWKDNDPSSGIPNFNIQVAYDPGYSANVFFPWRDDHAKSLILSGDRGTTYYIYVTDIYHSGNFGYTAYYFH